MKHRNSSYELLRLVAQWMIVAYHIILFHYIYDSSFVDKYYYASFFLLHTGVPVFVIISGFFKIKVSVKGLLKLLFCGLIYGTGLKLIGHFVYGDVLNPINLLPLSGTEYWFLRTYLFIYLLSPCINKYLNQINIHQRVCFIVILIYINFVCSTLRADPSLIEGKNILVFLLWYTVGDTLRKYEMNFKVVSTSVFLVLWIFLNLVIVICYLLINIKFWSFCVNELFFPYYSLGLLINSILLFIMFSRINIQSKFINTLSKSCLAIYLIHGSFILFHIIGPIANYIEANVSSVLLNYLLLFLVAAIVSLACIVVDKLLTPLWSIVDRLSEKITETKLGNYLVNYSDI